MARMAAGLVSYADLQRMPDDGRQYELYDGEVRVVPSPTNRHQVVLQNLVVLFLEYAKEHGGRLLFAPSDVVFTQYNVIQPDLLYFSEPRRHLVQLDKPTDVPPDLTVEVISPGTSSHDRGRKQAVCARFGVREAEILNGKYSARFRDLAVSFATHAKHFYSLARETLPAEDRRAMVAAELMGSVYWRLLQKLQAQQFNVFDPTPTRVSKVQKLFLIFRTWYRLSTGALVPNYGSP